MLQLENRNVTKLKIWQFNFTSVHFSVLQYIENQDTEKNHDQRSKYHGQNEEHTRTDWNLERGQITLNKIIFKNL